MITMGFKSELGVSPGRIDTSLGPCHKRMIGGACLLAVIAAWGLPSVCKADSQNAQAGEPICHAQEFQGMDEPVAWPKQQGVLRLDASCWVSPAQLRQRLARDEPVLQVDVRRHGWRTDALEGAIPLALQDLPHQTFLAQGEVVLIGSGLDVAELNQTCSDLRRQGWRISALQGGASAWLEHQHGLAQAITAQHWIMALGQGIDWRLVLDAGLSDEERNRLPSPPELLVNAKATTAQAVARRLLDFQQDLQRKATQETTHTAVVFLARGDVTAVLRALHEEQTSSRPPVSVVPIYVVQGGWDAYQAEVLQNHAIHATAQHGLARACGAL